jgi:hypothetical protein
MKPQSPLTGTAGERCQSGGAIGKHHSPATIGSRKHRSKLVSGAASTR